MLVGTEITGLAQELGSSLQARGLKIVTAESCTGGAIGAAITSVVGSSAWYEFGFITYSNAMKARYLNVPDALMAEYGVVSEPVVAAMLKGAIASTSADVAIAVSGIAGPGGAVPGKPVGTVCMAWGNAHTPVVTTQVFAGNRDQVREAAVKTTLTGLIQLLSK